MFKVGEFLGERELEGWQKKKIGQREERRKLLRWQFVLEEKKEKSGWPLG